MSDFTFNGVSAASLGLCIERYPTIEKPRKRLVSYTIPGRNGVLTQWDGSYEPVTVRYECWFRKLNKITDIPATAHKIADWLYDAPVGARLEDTYDAGYFRTATFTGGLDIENLLNRYGRCVLEFQCSPESWVVGSDILRTIPINGGFANNPTEYPCKPLFRVETTGAMGGTSKWGDNELALLFGQLDRPLTIYIDCDILEAWYVEDGVAVSCNQAVSSTEWPVLAPGLTPVSWAGLGISSVSIAPRSWKL